MKVTFFTALFSFFIALSILKPAFGQPIIEKVFYYDENGDSLIDREDHVFYDTNSEPLFSGHDNWKLLDTDFDGRYDLKKYNRPWPPYERKVDKPIPKNKTISEL